MKMIKKIKAGIILVPWLAFATTSHASDSYQKMRDEHHGAGHRGHEHHDESSIGKVTHKLTNLTKSVD